jgi:hypothetical protein
VILKATYIEITAVMETVLEMLVKFFSLIQCQLSELKVIGDGISLCYQTVMESNELNDLLSKLIGNEHNLECRFVWINTHIRQ